MLLFLVSSLFVAILISVIPFLKHKKSHNKTKQQLPPGQMGYPWIGETMEFYKSQRKNKLFEEFVLPRIRKHGNIFKTRLMGSPTVVVNGADANRFFLSNEFKLVISSWPSSSVQLMGKESIMEKQGERHRRLRGLIGNTLGYAGLEDLVPKICNSVRLHLETEWHGKEKISLYRSTKILMFAVVFECLLGIKVEPGMLETFERVLEGVFAPPIKFPGSRFWTLKKKILSPYIKS
jgi:cytochrome P450